ncbi:MAG: helix-turn-helix transcriptional regulator [Bacteroidia bacterium]|nr:helix-turn-helix transcriptional regulator [Bacteroidia bacterium]
MKMTGVTGICSRYGFLFTLWDFLSQNASTNLMMKNTLKVERAKKNWTQAELADKIGVSRQAINSIETGKFVPSTVLALKMAHVFETSVECIFQLEASD